MAENYINAGGYPAVLFDDVNYTFTTNAENVYLNSNCAFMFNGCSSLTDTDLVRCRWDNVTNCYGMFNGCSSFSQPVKIGPMAGDLSHMFSGCQSFTGPVTFAGNLRLQTPFMFNGCASFSAPISLSVANADSMFNGCASFNAQVTLRNIWHASNLFRGCTALNSPIYLSGNGRSDLGGVLARCQNYNAPVTFGPGVESIGGALANCYNFNSLVRFDPSAEQSEITSCAYLFRECFNYNQPFEIPARAQECAGLFFGCYNYNQPTTIPNGVKNCAGMFSSCLNFVQDITIPNGVKNCAGMFSSCNNFLNSGKNLRIPGSVENVYDMLAGYNRSGLGANVTFEEIYFEGGAAYSGFLSGLNTFNGVISLENYANASWSYEPGLYRYSEQSYGYDWINYYADGSNLIKSFNNVFYNDYGNAHFERYNNCSIIIRDLNREFRMLGAYDNGSGPLTYQIINLEETP